MKSLQQEPHSKSYSCLTCCCLRCGFVIKPLGIFLGKKPNQTSINQQRYLSFYTGMLEHLNCCSSLWASSFIFSSIQNKTLKSFQQELHFRCKTHFWGHRAARGCLILLSLVFSFCSYVWEHLEVGYVQGMCDLLAPLMVILDNGRKGFIVLHLFVSLERSVFRNAGSEAAIRVNQG